MKEIRYYETYRSKIHINHYFLCITPIVPRVKIEVIPIRQRIHTIGVSSIVVVILNTKVGAKLGHPNI